ncbi:hypothetical protein F5Y06DRAFT_283983 [Hypoxylon sp. FL0890]|nr:hypothetical protein F5Y06DRAFT_283983 [Hypoxylon sp. FL0890]
MEGLTHSRVSSALEDVIKEEVEFKLMNMSADDMINTIQRRQDCQTIHDKLFNHVDGARLTTMINAREDSRKIYVDLLKEVIAKMDTPSQTQHEHLAHPPTSSGRNPTVNVVASTQTDMEIPFAPQLPGLSAWVLTFMSKDECYSIGPHVNILDVTPKIQKVTKGFLDFTRFLNPPYLCARAEYVLSLTGKAGFTLHGLDNIRGVMKLWNTASYQGLDQRYTTDIAKAFSALHCFNHYRNMRGISARNDRFSQNSERLHNHSELEVFSKFTEIDAEYHGGQEDYHKQRWRNIVQFGGQLSPLVHDYGGEPFMLLFPLYELSKCINESLVDTHSMDYLWGRIKALLVETGFGDFLRSLSTAVGALLISSFRDADVSRRTFKEKLLPVLEMYSLRAVQLTYPSLDVDIKSECAPLVCCGHSAQPVHLSAESSFSPMLLLKLVNGWLGESVIRHLLRQGLSDDWCILGNAEVQQVASENMLLHDYKGIVIPLEIFEGWTLFFYTNPACSDVTHPIKFIDPTGNASKIQAAKRILSNWIPESEDWVPEKVNMQSIQPIASQVASPKDSVIHIILHAISMAKTGKPESRPLDANVCRAIRLRYFVNLLNEVQVAVAKASEKRSEESEAAV